jgi:hypothetical protein
MGAKPSSIARFTAQSDDVVIMDEHTIVREQVALGILSESNKDEEWRFLNIK